MNPFEVVDKFEHQLCEYTGAPFAVAVASCTDALGICFEYFMGELEEKHNVNMGVAVTMPKHTYIGVPMQAKRAGLELNFIDEDWKGEYKINISYYDFSNNHCRLDESIIDSARRFTYGMYKSGTFRCVSFHGSKILGYSHGGAILHNDYMFDRWARAARFDGRTFDGSDPTVLGRHANMTPDVAAALSYKLYHLPNHNPDLPNSNYPDLSKMEIFK